MVERNQRILIDFKNSSKILFALLIALGVELPAVAIADSGPEASPPSSENAVVSIGEPLHDQDLTVDPWKLDDDKIDEFKKKIERACADVLKEPNSVAPYINRADAYLHFHRFKEALDDSNKALSLKADTQERESNIYCNRGEAYLQMGKYNEALADLEKSISLDEECAEAHYYKGFVQERLGHVEAAIKEYKLARHFGFAPKGINIDFAPYMTNLQKSIKSEWRPPKGEESRKTVVHFRVYRNGLIDKLQLQTSSGLDASNEAAFDAVRAAAPFQPLPEGSPKCVDVEFSFDYNVFKNGTQNQNTTTINAAEVEGQKKVDAAEKSGNEADLVKALFNLGDIFKNASNYHYADNAYNRVKAIGEKHGDTDPIVVKAIGKLAEVELARGKKRESEALFTQALDLAAKAGRPQTDPDTGLVLREYAKLLYRQNRFEDVKKMYARFKQI